MAKVGEIIRIIVDYCTCMKDSKGFWWVYVAAWAVVFGIVLVWIGYYTGRGFFEDLLVVYTLLFGLYMVVIRFESFLLGSITWKHVLGLGIIFRFLLIFSTPNLSDDCYRFLWDGMLTDMGVHPFLYTPREAVQQVMLPAYHVDLIDRMNSPDYHTVYPPLSQVVFWFSVKLGGGDLGQALLVLKSLVFLGEVFTMVSLGLFLGVAHKGLERSGLVWYAFNPLVILETVGNVHFEGMMAGFILLSCWALQIGRIRLAAFLWASAISVKLLPLLAIPVIFAWLGRRRAFLFGWVCMLSLVIYFLPLARPSVFLHLLSSVGLYFRQFEFNASFYYIGAYGSRFITGWHEGRLVSPLLASVTVSVALYLSMFIYRRRYLGLGYLQFSFLILWTVYLLNAATVHPWYVLLPFVLSLGTGFMYPLVWTWVVYFSYSHYSGGIYEERFGWIILEYFVLLVVLWRDIRRVRGSRG